MHDRTKIREWYSGISRRGRLRTKFLLSLLLVSASLTCSTLLVVRHRLQIQIREEIRQDLQNSAVTFQIFQRQREIGLEGSAAMVANLPIVEALMTSRDAATIQDASAALWRKTGGDLFVLADRKGQLMALHAVNPSLTPAQAGEMLQRSQYSMKTQHEEPTVSPVSRQLGLLTPTDAGARSPSRTRNCPTRTFYPLLTT